MGVLNFQRFLCFLVLVTSFLGAGCGTFSVLRPGDVLKKGEAEFAAGIAVSGIPEVTTVVQGNHGLTDAVELGAQAESKNFLGWARVGLFSTEIHGFGLSLLGGGGYASIFDVSKGTFSSGTLVFGLSVGQRLEKVEYYLGYRLLYFPEFSWVINSIKAGVRYPITPYLLVGAEGGVAIHHTFFTLGEGTLFVGFLI